jgi:hypothetical protein
MNPQQTSFTGTSAVTIRFTDGGFDTFRPPPTCECGERDLIPLAYVCPTCGEVHG